MAKNNLKMVKKSKSENVSLGDLFELRGTIQSIVSQPMEAVSAYKIAKLAKRIEEEYSSIETIRRNLIVKHGKQFQDEKTGQTTIPPDTKEFGEFIKEFQEFLTKESEISKSDFASAIVLEDLKGITISPAQMLKLSEFME